MHSICNVSYLPYARTLGLWNLLGFNVCAYFGFRLTDTFLSKFVIHNLIKIDQLISLALFFVQHVSNASTFIFRSLRLCVGILLCKDRVIYY